MTFVELLVLGLATWRTSSLLAEESWPWDLGEKFRRAIGVRYDEESFAYGTNELARQVVCVWCVSTWVGLGWAAAFSLWPRATFAIALPFALSTVAVIVNARGVRNRKRYS